MTRCTKIKWAVQESLHTRTRKSIQVCDTEQQPPRLILEPDAVGKVFSKCLAPLWADPSFQVDENTYASDIQYLPECPSGTSAKPLQSPETMSQEKQSAPQPLKGFCLGR